MWGVPLSSLAGRVEERDFYLPSILKLVSAEDGVKVGLDSSHFSYLFRGTVGADGDYARRPVSTPDLIGQYIEKGYLTHGSASDADVLHTTKNPLVAFSSDRWGDFS